eukprot:1160806-Pelagomonas_calceolata.AAC.1
MHNRWSNVHAGVKCAPAATIVCVLAKAAMRARTAACSSSSNWASKSTLGSNGTVQGTGQECDQLLATR